MDKEQLTFQVSCQSEVGGIVIFLFIVLEEAQAGNECILASIERGGGDTDAIDIGGESTCLRVPLEWGRPAGGEG